MKVIALEEHVSLPGSYVKLRSSTRDGRFMASVVSDLQPRGLEGDEAVRELHCTIP